MTQRGRAGQERVAAEQSADQAAARVVTGVEPHAGPGAERRFVSDVGRAIRHDFSQVRIHDDDASHRFTHALGAEAVTVGHHVLFAAGKRDVTRPAGRELLAHELAHVRQQAATGPRVACKFVATGSTADFVDMVNSILGVQFAIQASVTGEISVVRTDVQGPPTRDATELLRVVRMLVNDSGTTTIRFVHGDNGAAANRNVIVGSYAIERVDLDDIAQFGFVSSHSRQGDNAATQLVHELSEQHRKQIYGESFPVAHQAGYAAQERQLGATLVLETPMTPTTGTQGEVTTTYRYPDNREVDVTVTIDFATGAIIDVTRTIRNTRRRGSGGTP